MAEVKWIKIVTDIFDDEKILLIESMPDADSVIVIWFKLLCLAGKQNNHGVFQMGHMPYTDEMFATVFRRPVNTVRLALKVFQEYGMVEIVDDTVTIPGWGRHQSLDSFEKKKLRDRQYQAERRAKQAEIVENAEKSSDNRLTVARQSSDESSDVAISDKKEKEIRLEDIKETNKEKDDELDPRVKDAVNSYYRMRKGIRRPMTKDAVQRLVTKLKSMSSDPDVQLRIVQQAEDRNYLDLYPLDEDKKKEPRRNSFTDFGQHDDYDIRELERKAKNEGMDE